MDIHPEASQGRRVGPESARDREKQRFRRLRLERRGPDQLHPWGGAWPGHLSCLGVQSLHGVFCAEIMSCTAMQLLPKSSHVRFIDGHGFLRISAERRFSSRVSGIWCRPRPTG